MVGAVYLFIFIYLFLAALGCCCVRGTTLLGGAQTSYCGVSSCCGARALSTPASVVAACRLNSCSSWALSRVQAQYLWWACGIFPSWGSNPCIAVLADGFLTTAQPGKSQNTAFIFQTWNESLDCFMWKCTWGNTVIFMYCLHNMKSKLLY